MNRRRFAVLVLAAAVVTACPKKEDTIIESGAGKSLTDEQIDREPLALLPSGGIGYATADAKQLFASEFGQKLLSLAKARAPVPPSAGFEPSRDLDRLYVGVYSMQGADFAVVATGRFDRTAIESAADGVQQTPLGAPLVKSSYAGRSLYTSRNLGFTVLTSRTVLLGNETGIRRALDRIKEGRVKLSVPDWMAELIATPNAPIAAGFDLRAQPLTDATRQQLPFLEGLETARMLANFEPPGLNVAGTLTYPDEAAAQRGAAALKRVDEMAKSWGWVASLLGIAQPIQKLEAQSQGSDAQFVAGLDGKAVGQLLDQAANYLGVPSQPSVIPATTSPGMSGAAGQ